MKKTLQGFAGVNASFNVFSLGELGAQESGEVDAERRADVEARGTILEGGVLDSKCTGHEAEPTPTGPTQPVTEGGAVTGVPAGADTSGAAVAPAEAVAVAGPAGTEAGAAVAASEVAAGSGFEEQQAQIEQLASDAEVAQDEVPAAAGSEQDEGANLFEEAFA